MLPAFCKVLWLDASLWALLEALVGLFPLSHNMSDSRSASPDLGMGNPGISSHTGAHGLTALWTGSPDMKPQWLTCWPLAAP